MFAGIDAAMEKRELKNRWTGESLGLVLKRLRSGQALDLFGRTADGKCDLRGFNIQEILRNVSIVDVDLSHCSTERGGQFLGCTLTNVDLSRSILKTNIDGAFSNCIFDESTLTAA